MCPYGSRESFAWTVAWSSRRQTSDLHFHFLRHVFRVLLEPAADDDKRGQVELDDGAEHRDVVDDDLFCSEVRRRVVETVAKLFEINSVVNVKKHVLEGNLDIPLKNKNTLHDVNIL